MAGDQRGGERGIDADLPMGFDGQIRREAAASRRVKPSSCIAARLRRRISSESALDIPASFPLRHPR